MKLYNGIQVIKCSIRRMFSNHKVGADAEGDVQLLSAMCAEAHVLHAINGKDYWYYFPDTMEHKEIAQYLLERNGVVPTFRMSRHFAGFGRRRPAFRLSQSYLLRYPELNEFVNKIEERDYSLQMDEELQKKILHVRNQMGKRQR